MQRTFGPQPTKNCGTRVSRTDKYSIFTMDMTKQGNNGKGDPYIRYHIHWRLRKAYWPHAERTYMDAYGWLPSGPDRQVRVGHGDTYDKLDREDRGITVKRYYAHFTEPFKPGKPIEIFGHSIFKEPGIYLYTRGAYAAYMKGLGLLPYSCIANATGSPRSGPADIAGPTIVTGPADSSASTSATFEFVDPADDNLDCQVDDGAWTPCAWQLQLNSLAAGPHHLIVRAGDAGAYRYANWGWNVE